MVAGDQNSLFNLRQNSFNWKETKHFNTIVNNTKAKPRFPNTKLPLSQYLFTPYQDSPLLLLPFLLSAFLVPLVGYLFSASVFTSPAVTAPVFTVRLLLSPLLPGLHDWVSPRPSSTAEYRPSSTTEYRPSSTAEYRPSFTAKHRPSSRLPLTLLANTTLYILKYFCRKESTVKNIKFYEINENKGSIFVFIIQ